MASTPSSSSVSAFVSALILYGLIALLFVAVFVSFRSKKTRVYQPRNVVNNLPARFQTEAPPKGAFAWISYLLSKPESYVIEKAGVDGYFFLRYLFTFASISLVGGLFLWPVLFAVDATGGGGLTGFNIISYSNVTHKWYTFAHVFCSWLFFGLVIFTIYKELIYYTSFRHSMQNTPYYSSLLSTRTLLLDNIPTKYLDNEEEMVRLFPKGINFWYTRKTKDLQDVVKKRTKMFNKIEAGMNKTLVKAIKSRAKLLKKNKPVPQPANEIVSYIPEKKLPTYKDKPIPLIFKSKKLLTEGVVEYHDLNTKVMSYQQNYPNEDEFPKTGSIFVEFQNHYDFQQAYQMIPHVSDLKFSRRHIGMSPDEVIWENTGLSNKERYPKKILAVSVLTWLVLFWCIPVAVVGAISNINMLTDKVHFLRFINNLPSVLLGLITSLLPTIMLAVLMSLLPPFIRKMGKVSGLLTIQEVERWTQQWYFAFEVIQVFLVTTLASAAASSVTQIISNPSNAMSLLGQYLPPASNFYISYLLLQGLSISSGALAQLVPLILSLFLGRILDKTPRKKWNRFNSIGSPAWGTTYGLYGMLTVIMLCYSVIAPIIIAFTLIAYGLIYLAFLYNLNYVSIPGVDNRGRNYPLALFQVFVGLYLSELCLIALFVMPKNWACVALEVVCLVATVAAHLYLRWRFEPILDTVPLECIANPNDYPMADQGLKSVKQGGKLSAEDVYASTEPVGAAGGETFRDDHTAAEGGDDLISMSLKNSEKGEKDHKIGTPSAGQYSVFSDRAETAAESHSNTNSNSNSHLNYNEKKSESIDESGNMMYQTNPALEDNNRYPATQSTGYKGYMASFLHPRATYSYSTVSAMLPLSLQEPVHYDAENAINYNDPASQAEESVVWIPADSVGLSKQFIEIGQVDSKLSVSDVNAVVHDDGKVEYTGNPPDYSPGPDA